VTAPGIPGVTALGDTLNQGLLAACERYGENWFLRQVRPDGSFEDIGRPLFLDMALRAAAWCQAHGLSPGDRAILCLENSPAWGAVYFGILLAGGVAVPIDAQSTPGDAAYYLETTRARLVFAAEASLFGGSDTVMATDIPAVLASDPLPKERMHPAAPGDLAVLIFTSGTTGMPKAVMLTHANLMANLEGIRRLELLLPEDNFLAVLPLHHAYPCMVNLLTPLFLGVRSTYIATLKPEAILGALKTAGVTILVLTPQYLGVFHRRIVKRFEDLPLGAGRLLLSLLRISAGWPADPLTSVRRAVLRGVGPRFRFFLTGGAKSDPALLAEMAALGLTVLEGYGLSETAPVVSINPPGSGKPGSVGHALPGVEMRIDGPDNEGYGEILVRGPNVMAGYFENPEASAKALQDGWFHTGDQGRLDAEGFLTVRGRERDIIVLPSGKKFPAEEVETHYRQAPSIGDIAVLPGPGGTLEAVITPNAEHFKTLDSPDIRHNIRWDLEFYSRDLPGYKRVRNFTILPGDLPKTRLGKLKRHLVEELLAEHRRKTQAAKSAAKQAGQRSAATAGGPDDAGQAGGADASAWPGLTPAGERVLAALREVSGEEAVTPSPHLELDLGLDSLKRVELLTVLEDATGQTLGEEDFFRLTTAGEVMALALAQAGNGEAAEGDAAFARGLLDPLPPELSGKIRLERDWTDSLVAGLLGGVVSGLARLLFRLEVRGRENIPPGGALLCPNHASYLDGFMLLAAVSRRERPRLFFLGLARFFEARLVAPLAVRLRLIPVDAGRLSEAMRLSAVVLGNGKLLCMFPEGGRTVTGELGEFRKGAAILARELQAPVVPVAIRGTFAAWPAGGKLRLRRVAVEFGKPLQTVRNIDEIREAVNNLLTHHT